MNKGNDNLGDSLEEDEDYLMKQMRKKLNQIRSKYEEEDEKE